MSLSALGKAISSLADQIRLIAIGAIAVLVVAIIVQAQAVISRGAAVERSLRYDIAMTGLNGRVDAVNAKERFSSFMAKQTPEAAYEAQLFYEILLGRIDTWLSGAFRAFVGRSNDRLEMLEHLRDDLTTLSPAYADLPVTEDTDTIDETLSRAVAVMTRIGGEALMHNLREAETTRNALQHQQRIQNKLVLTLIALGAVLLVLMSVQSTDLKRARSAAERNARKFQAVSHRDPLTGLPNRLDFNARLDAGLREAAGTQGSRGLFLFLLDLDGFKGINDMMGHIAGDRLLVSVARCLRETTNEWGDARAHVARLGGDEFTVLLWGTGGLDDALEKAEALVEVLRAPHDLDCGQVVANASIGVAEATRSAFDRDVLMQNADLALRYAKNQGRGRALAFDKSMRAKASRDKAIEVELEEALSKGHLVPHFQPQVDITNGQVIGCEALARWQHRALGWISPAEFVPIAEASGQIVALGEHILRAACREVRWMDSRLPVSVNLSIAQLAQPDFVETVADALHETELEPQRLRLEVTESMVMSDPERAISTLERLKKLGVSIALDDFGTGYSALSYLRNFAWDEIKIDRSFVQTLESDPNSLSIISSIVELADRLQIGVIVEGVETQSQLRLISRTGCRVVQGFLYGRPMAPADFAAYLQREIPHPEVGIGAVRSR